jgi:hypothetical protein
VRKRVRAAFAIIVGVASMSATAGVIRDHVDSAQNESAVERDGRTHIIAATAEKFVVHDAWRDARNRLARALVPDDRDETSVSMAPQARSFSVLFTGLASILIISTLRHRSD